MEQGEIWSKYTSDAAQAKIDNIQERIHKAEIEYENNLATLKANLSQPKAINLYELTNLSPSLKSSTHLQKRGVNDLQIVLKHGSGDELLDFDTGLTKSEEDLTGKHH